MNKKILIDREHLAILLFNKNQKQWEDRTMSISAMFEAHYYGKHTGYNVYFRGTNKYFFYSIRSVQFLKKIQSINIENHDVYVNNDVINAAKVDKFEEGYYRIYTEKTAVFTKNLDFKSNKYKEIFKYYVNLAEYAGTIADEKSPLYYLSKNYKRISPSKDSVVFGYLQGECNLIQLTTTPIVPFDFNQSQIRAIRTALENKISVIEGPPGTGKTQTILNLIANIICCGKNCAIVSNNNTAIDNIYDKLKEENLSFIAAFLGNQTNVTRFFEADQNQELTNFIQQKENTIESSVHSRINTLSAQIKKIQNLEVETSILESQLDELKTEKKYHDNCFKNSANINQTLSSEDYLSFIKRLEKPKKLWFFEKWLLGIKFKVKFSLHDITQLLISAEKQFYKSKITKLISKIESNKKILENYNKKQISKELKELCRMFFDKFIRSYYLNSTIKNFNKGTYKNDFENFLFRYPVILSTSYSLFNNIPKGFTFDYLIIDEASQGDLLSSVLAMSCAKSLVVVGDSKQLQQIDEKLLFSQSEKLSIMYSIPKPYRYESNSILKSVKEAIPNIPTTLLKEHYRCAPDIINFCSKMFYNGELVAMTKNTGQHITIIKTVPGNHARHNPDGSGQYNLREIDEIEHVLNESVSDSIGIISPFRCQANLIGEKYVGKPIEADTIHKFQGRQKKEIILSFVVNSLDKNPDNDTNNRLYNFVTNKQLFNVAISRGQNKITAIVSDKVYNSSNNVIHDFIKYAEYLYGSDIVKASTITSAFDVLYTEYTSTILSIMNKYPNQHKAELLMCEVIKEVLLNHNFIEYSMHIRLSKLVNIPDTFTEEEKRYILHPWTHVDFLFYNKLSKENLFVLEVDGIRYHEQNKKQTKHDDIKNRILQSNNIPVFRFKTNESNEKQRLTEIINLYSH